MTIPPLVAAVQAGDLEAVRAALAGGENPRLYFEGETLLHVAARLGPLSIVEALIEGNAFEWQSTLDGRSTLEIARGGSSPDRDAIVAVLDRRAIADPSFRAAVAAVHAGDVATLARLIDAEPRLLRERIEGPAVYRRHRRSDYFRDPKLFWYVANNPTTVPTMPANIVDVASAMIERGVDKEDLDTTLGLVMSSGVAAQQGHQRGLMRALIAAGATDVRDGIVVAAAHGLIDPLRALVEWGVPIDAPIAAAIGDVESLRRVLPDASAGDVQLAFGLAVINRRGEAVRLTLEAGADVNAFLPIHAHSTALHQAVSNGDLEMIALLVRNGADGEVRDKLWNGTPAGWARHLENDRALTALG